MIQPPLPPTEIIARIKNGLFIPAHPLALNGERKFDERRMTALTRYYFDAGAGGLAVGVHTTQFEIRNPSIGLYKPVLGNVAHTVNEYNNSGKTIALIAGICGPLHQAVNEAKTAVDIGYHTGLLSLGAMKDATDDELISHCAAVAEVIPLFGFYLQPAVGGRKLGFDFWWNFCQIENAIAIKVAPFDRYETIEVARAVVEAGRAGDIALYTGNDDNIVGDLLTTFRFSDDPGTDEFGGHKSIRIAGGLLGQWAVWTKTAVELFNEIKSLISSKSPVPQRILTLGAQLTDANAAIFDAANNFAGCISGINEILSRQGLLEGRWCLDPALDLSPGQTDQINRVITAYPHLTDDEFVSKHLDDWLN